MKINFKRFLSFVLAFVMVFGMVPANVYATSEETTVEPVDDVIAYAAIDDTTAKLTDGKSASGDIVIPETVTIDGVEYTVVAIADNAFNGAAEVTSVEVPDTVTTLGGAAFANMDKLKTLKIGSGVTSWGSKLAVNNYELETVVIAEGATLIGDLAFRTCPKLANVTLPSTLKTIGATAFAYSAITELVIPASVESIGADCFKDIDTLKKVTFLGANTKLGSTCFQMCDGLEEVILPANLTVIPQGAFRYCTALKTIEFPETLTEIGNYSFQGCTSLESVTISKNITKLVTNAFNGCTSLKDLTIEEGFCGEIGGYVFQGCTALESVVIPSSMATVGESMFNECSSLKNVTLSEGVKTLNISAFANCTSLETLTLPDSLERMRHGSIANCTSLKHLIITGENLPVIEHSNALEGLSSDLVVYYSGEDEFTGNWSALAGNVTGEEYSEPVAMIGSQGYKTLAEAIENATAGDTIVLLTDNAENVTVSKSLTIDGEYKTFSGTMTVNDVGVTLTILNATLKAADSYVIYTEQSNINIENCVLTSDATAAEYYNTKAVVKAVQADNSNVKISGCTISNVYYPVYFTQGGMSLVIENSTVTDCVYLSSAMKCKDVTIEDVTYTGMAGLNIRNTSAELVLKNVQITTTMEGQYPVAMMKPESGVSAVTYTIYLMGEGNTANGVQMHKSNEAEWFVRQDESNPYEIIDETMPKVAQVDGIGYDSFADAVKAANAVEGGATVTLLADVTLGEKLTISGNVTIVGEHTITRADGYTGTLFTVNKGAELTLDGGLVVDGGNEWTMNMEAYKADLASFAVVPKAESAKWFTPEKDAPVATAFMITTTGGTVNLNDVTIQNNYSVSSGIVSAGANSTITLTGAKISHVAATQGNGVVANVSGANINVTVNEGTVIDGNHVGGNHGIFKIYSGAVLTMNGGEIKNTTGWNSNGIVVGLYWGTFNMKGGRICSNSAANGPDNGRSAAVYLHSGHTFNMSGGEICHNRGGSRGGVDAPYSNGSVSITGGYIGDNSSYYEERGYGASYPPDVNLPTNGTASITGGSFTQDVSKWLAPNTGLVYDAETGTYSLTNKLFEYNGTVYESMTEIIAAIKTARTSDVPVIKVLASHKPSETIVIDVPITLDLNGQNIYGYNTVNPVIRVLSDVTVTGNGMIDTANQGDGYCFIVGDTETAGNLTIKNGTFKGTTTAVSVTKGTATLLDGDYRVKPWNNDAGVSVYDYLLNCIDANYKNGDAKIIVKGGVFTSFNPADNAAEGAGTSFLPEGYIAEELTSGKWTVRSYNPVAEVDGKKYESLQAAINACKSGETVVLLTDIIYDTDDVVYAHGGATGFGNYDQYNPSIIYVGGTKGATAAENQPSGVNVVIDLNGHIVTSNADAYMFLFMDNCKVTMKDSVGGGKVVNNSTNYPAVWAVGTDTLVTIKSGTYQTASPYGLIHATHSGDLVIEGGHFSTTASNASLLLMINSQKYNNPNYFLQGVATLTVKGGTFVGFNPEKVGDDYGAASIEDIKFVDGCANGYASVDNGDGTYGVTTAIEISGYSKADGEKFWITFNQDHFGLSNVEMMDHDNYDWVMTLKNDVVVSEPIVVNKDLTIDLSGYTLTGDNVYPVIRVQNGAKVTVKNGTITNDDYVFVLGASNGSSAGYLTVEGGTYTGMVTVASVTKGTLTIQGGNFAVKDSEYGAAYLLNCVDANYKDGSAKIVACGGTFKGFNPENNAAEGAGTSFLPDGYIAEELTEGYFTVRQANYVAQVGETKYESLTEAIAAAKEAGSAVTVLRTVELTEDGTLDLQGVRLNASANLQNAPVIRVLAKIEVVNAGIIDGCGPVAGEGGVNCYAFIVGNDETAGELTISGGTYRGVTSAISITNGVCNISGGTFQTGHDNEGTDYGAVYLLNCVDSAYKAGNAKFNITGGKFVGFNPEKNAAEGEGTNFLSGNFKASDWYGDNKWYVAEANVEMTIGDRTVYCKDIYDALNVIQPRETATIKLLSDFTITADQRMFSNYSIVINAEYITLDLNGKTVTFDYEGSTATCYAAIAIYNQGTLKIIDSSEEKTGTLYNKTLIQGTDGPRILWVTSAGSATIEGGNFISEQGDTMFYCSNSNMEVPTTLYIKGGYFEHTVTTNGGKYRYFNIQDGGGQEIIEVSGGTFKHDFTDGEMRFPEGYKAGQNPDGTWSVVPAATKVTVTVNDVTYVEGNAIPKFTYTTDVECPELDITYTVDGTVINATVAQMDGYEFTVVPGTLTVEKAVVRVYAANNANVIHFSDFAEGIAYAVEQKGYVPVYVLENITVDETIVINDANGGTVELQSIKLGANTYKLTSTFDGPMFKIEKAQTFSIKNMIISSYGDTFYVTDGNLNLNCHSEGKQFIEITSQTGNCVYIRGGKVNVNGAKLTALGEYPAIQGNGNFGGDVTITKWNIGSVLADISAPNSDMAIYWPGNGKLTVEMGTITGDTAIYAKSGTVTINGGEFHGTGEKKDFVHNSNGAYATGDAVVIESCMDAAYETPLVSVSGGTFVSDNAEAFAVYHCNESAVLEKFITGGTYSSEPEKALVADGYIAVQNEDKTWTVKEEVVITLSNQTIVSGNSIDQTAYTAGKEIEGLEVRIFATVDDCTTPGTYTITATATEPSGKYGFTIVDAELTVLQAVCAIGEVNYASLADAVKAVPTGATAETTTIKLLVPELKISSLMVGHSYAQNITIDLNGGKIYASDVTLTAYRSGTTLTLVNGTVSGNSTGGTLRATYGGKLVLGEKMTVTSGSRANAIRVDNGTLVINSDINVTGGVNWLVTTANTKNTVTVSAGTFTGGMSVGDGTKMQLSGGFYTVEPKADWCVEGYEVKRYGKDMWTVAPVSSTITVDGVWFENWEAAESAIEKNSVIKLFADQTNSKGTTAFKSKGDLTLDLNGYTLSSPYEAGAVNSMPVEYTNLYVVDSFGGGKLIGNDSHSLFAYINGVVYFRDGVQFIGSLQSTNGKGTFYVDGVELLGANGIFQTNGSTGRIKMYENGDWSFIYGNLTMTADYAELTGNTLTISSGCSIDLKGHSLTAKNIAAYGNLIDTADGVGDVCVSGEIHYGNHANAGYLPLYDTGNDCYRLYQTEVKIRGAKVVDEDRVKFGYTIYFNHANAYQLLKEMAENNKAVMTVAWEGSLNGSFKYTITNEMVADFAEAAIKQLTENGVVKIAINLNVDGFAEHSSGDVVTVSPSVESNLGVMVTGEDYVFTVA